MLASNHGRIFECLLSNHFVVLRFIFFQHRKSFRLSRALKIRLAQQILNSIQNLYPRRFVLLESLKEFVSPSETFSTPLPAHHKITFLKCYVFNLVQNAQTNGSRWINIRMEEPLRKLALIPCFYDETRFCVYFRRSRRILIREFHRQRVESILPRRSWFSRNTTNPAR